jgi:hypothetical protein
VSRETLTARRHHESFTFRFEGHPHEVGLGFYPDGRLAEVFIEVARVGTPMNLLVKEAAIMVSFALQHGCTIDGMRSAMPRRNDGTAEGLIGALLDHIAKLEFAP